MLKIKKGKELSQALGSLKDGDCFLYDSKHWRRISEDTDDGFKCYCFTQNFTKSLDPRVRVRRMPFYLSEDPPIDTLYLTGSVQGSQDIFVVSLVTGDKAEAIKLADESADRYTWQVFEAGIGDIFGNWTVIHEAEKK